MYGFFITADGNLPSQYNASEFSNGLTVLKIGDNGTLGRTISIPTIANLPIDQNFNLSVDVRPVDSNSRQIEEGVFYGPFNTSTSANPLPNESVNGSSLGGILGGAVGGLFLVTFIASGAVFFVRRQKAAARIGK